jgi:primosomal protein N' (replication factor Y)
MTGPSGAAQTRLDLDEPQAGQVRAVPVLVPLALDEAYDYQPPEGESPPPGTFVRVPLGSARRIGVVWGAARTADIPARKLKSIIEVLDAPPLPAVSRRMVDWVANYTLSPRGMVLKMMMSAPRAFEPEAPRFGYRAAGPPPSKLTPARQKVLAAAADGKVRAKADLAREAGVSAAVIEGLAKTGALIRVEMPPPRPTLPDPDHAPPELAPEQADAAGKLIHPVRRAGFSVSLLDGVTGAGKTEVYFEAIAAALARGGQVLILLPEIALTSQFLDRFARRFGCRPMEWHSAMGAAERGRIWRAVAKGEARAVAGARSALFLPFNDLGLIVVDEEHEQSFKQEDYVRYQARDVAVVRAKLGKHPVILSSATPSIESVVNAKAGRYEHVRLSARYSGAALPDIRAIDLRADPPERGRWLSPPLVSAVRDALGADKQALLFLNRRGYAPLTLCRACGHRIECPQCSATLVEHRHRGKLSCHHCGFVLPRPGDCPACGVSGKLVPCGPGVERVAEEVAERFPDVPAAILSSDFTTNLTEIRETIARIASGEARIIVGTQLVAKGHHFPGLALVGVVDGDLSLAQGGDPRAAERTFQLMQQVIGRAGREDSGGIGLIQTHAPDHPVMCALISGDRDTFLAREIAARKEAALPPFGRLAALIVSGGAKPEAERYAQALARAAPHAPRITVMGPAEAPLALIRGRYRFRLLVKAPREVDLQGFLRLWMDRAPPAKGSVRTVIDVDPYSFL